MKILNGWKIIFYGKSKSSMVINCVHEKRLYLKSITRILFKRLGGKDVSLIILILLLLKCSSCSFCPNLIGLDLSHNIIQFSSKLIRDMFTPLKKLKSIWLESISHWKLFLSVTFTFVLAIQFRNHMISQVHEKRLYLKSITRILFKRLGGKDVSYITGS
jgi:hypothetical protein